MVLWGIINEHVWESALERYRSGHNEAVLKTVCPQGRVGSNPTLSANCTAEPERWVPGAALNNTLAQKHEVSKPMQKDTGGWSEHRGNGLGRY